MKDYKKYLGDYNFLLEKEMRDKYQYECTADEFSDNQAKLMESAFEDLEIEPEDEDEWQELQKWLYDHCDADEIRKDIIRESQENDI